MEKPSRRPSISFEFFPPKTPDMADILMTAAKDLQSLDPAFVTVTCGAGGKIGNKTGGAMGQAETFETALSLKKTYGYAAGVHIRYFGSKKSALMKYADTIWENDLHHLVALRGDIPAGTPTARYKEPDFFERTSDFVESLLTRHPFDISVAAYPEKHPDAPDMAADIQALKLKCGAGATRAITQFFFDTSVYTNFIKDARAAGITTNIVPGLLPIHDLPKVRAFAEKCHARIPDNVIARFATSNNPTQTAIDILAEQIDDFIKLGVPHLHFYTLNRADLILSAFQKQGTK